MSPVVAESGMRVDRGVLFRYGESGGRRERRGANEWRMCCLYWIRVP